MNSMSAYHIDGYQFGKITIAGISYTKDLIILPGRIITGWWRKEGHLLQAADLSAVLDTEPHLLIVGQGAYNRMQVAPDVGQALAAAGIEWSAFDTAQACQEFNRKASGGQVAAALHLTC